MTDIMLFAAGLGTRMRPLTDRQPKPLIPVGETTLLDHALDLTDIQEISGRVLNVHYKADQIRDHIAEKPVSVSDETDLLRDTGGGFKHALPLLEGDLLLGLNTDAIWSGPNPIPLLLNAWQDHMTCLLMLVPQSRTYGHKGNGDFIVSDDGQLTRGPGPIYTGLQLTRRNVLDEIDEAVFSMNLAWNAAAAQGGLFGTLYPGKWCDVGQPDSLPIAASLLTEAADV
ncbi:MAG: nucleotidyltransferase family protein [Pseudomonadota bacterium]